MKGLSDTREDPVGAIIAAVWIGIAQEYKSEQQNKEGMYGHTTISQDHLFHSKDYPDARRKSMIVVPDQQNVVSIAQ